MKFEVLSARSGETLGMYTAASQAGSIEMLTRCRAAYVEAAHFLGAHADWRDLVSYELPARMTDGYIIYSHAGFIIGRGRTAAAALVRARKANHAHYWDTYFASVGDNTPWFESGREELVIARLGWRLVKTSPKCKCSNH